MAEFDMEELRKLSPEQRLKILKKLEEKSKEEIESARKLMAESEREIEVKEEHDRDMPVPQLASIDIESLFTPEEKELFKTKRFISDKIRDITAEDSESAKKMKGKQDSGRKTVDDIASRTERELSGARPDQWEESREGSPGKGGWHEQEQESIQKQYNIKMEQIHNRVYQLQDMAENDPSRFQHYQGQYKEELEMMKNEWEHLRDKYKSAGDRISEETTLTGQIDKLIGWYKR